jgi:hypothetical protein
MCFSALMAPSPFTTKRYSNLLERRSELLVIDAEKMQEIARVILPFQIAAQVHGTWASHEDIPIP